MRRERDRLAILTFCIRPGARRRGFGTALMSRIEDITRETGVEEIILEVVATNDPALALYVASGFESAGFRKDYYELSSGRRVHARILHKSLTAPR